MAKFNKRKSAYIFLQIGLKNEDMHFNDTDNYVDLKDKLTIDQIVDLVNKTKIFFNNR